MSTDTHSADDTSTELPAPESEPETIDPPDLTSSVTYIGQYRAYRKYRKKLKKKVSEGYIAWFLIDDGVPAEPKWIQPTDEGGGIPEYEHDDETYLFPRECRLPSKKYGTWTVFHTKGDPEPIDLRNPREPVITAAALQQYKNMRPNVEQPSSGMFGWDIDMEDAMKYALPGMIIIMLLYGLFGGVI